MTSIGYSSSVLAHAALQGALALTLSATAIPVFVYWRYGRDVGRVVILLFAPIALGAFLVGAPLLRVALAIVARPGAGGALSAFAPIVVVGLYALMVAHLALLCLPRLRGAFVRWAVVVPGTVLVTACLIATPFAAIGALVRAAVGAGAGAGATAIELLPLLVAVLAIRPSMRPRRETVRVVAGAERPATPTRLAYERLDGEHPRASATTLRIAQITDVHLGGLTTIAGLRRMVTRLLARRPDLILLTGDFLALEGIETPGALAEALAPLGGLKGKCFAVFGNHDSDAPSEVRGALTSAGVRLLVDEAAVVRTRVGDVEIVGVDHVTRDRRAHLRSVLARPKAPSARLRIVLLHDPSRFADVTAPWPDLVLSGHVHGGQIGLLSVGLPWTILSPTRIPDHGYFGMGGARLYAHRGTGTFGFPMRIGVPGEESVLDLEVASLPVPAPTNVQ